MFGTVAMFAVVRGLATDLTSCGSVTCFRKPVGKCIAINCKPLQLPIGRHIFTGQSTKRVCLPSGKQLHVFDSFGRTMSNKSEIVQAVACKVGDMKNGEMREVNLGDDGKVLLVKESDQFCAVGHKCTHYGAPLIKGVLSNGRVRCPWHGACFSVKTGDIEDYPGLDSLQRYEVSVEKGGNVIVKAEKSKLQNGKRLRNMVEPDVSTQDPGVVIVGGGAAAITCAETLRQESFKGKITILTLDNHPPYDRPKLSKAMSVTAESIYLRKPDFYEKYGIKVKCGSAVTKVDASDKSVTLANGSVIQYDKLLLATGGKPRTLPIPGWELNNVHVLRTPEDANTILEKAKGKKVVVIGASFIGMEVASSLITAAESVTVCEYFSVPFERVLGPNVGKVLQAMHEERGIKFCMNASVTELRGEAGDVKQAVLKTGTVLETDLVVAGVGVVPATDFLKGSEIGTDKRGFIEVDRHLQTNVKDVFAAGDIAVFPLKMRNWEPANVQHWQMAHYHGSVVGKNMFGQTKTELDSVPFFWTVIQQGKNLRYAGYNMGYDDIVIKGNLEERKFCAYYCKGDDVIAMASLMCDPAASEAAEKWYNGQSMKKANLE